MILTTCILASMLIAQKAPVQNTQETGVRFDFPDVKFDGTTWVKPGEPVKFLVHVRDVDATVFINNETGELRAEASYSGGYHSILIDPENRGAKAFGETKYVTQDQIIFKKIGWDEDKQWYTYEVTVDIPEDQQKHQAVFTVALEVRDVCPAPWQRDKSQFCGTTIIFKEPK